MEAPARSSWLPLSWWHFAATGLLLLAAYFLYSGLGSYSDCYDSGVYLESTRMMRRGFAPYRQIFDSQPPLWLPLLYAAFRTCGESFLTGQLLTGTTGLITIVAVMLISGHLGGPGGSLLAGILLILSPLELEWSRTINADIPSVAIAAVGIFFGAGYARNGRRGWLIAASVAASCSTLIKLSGLYATPSLLLFALARATNAYDTSLERIRLVTHDIFIVFGVIVSITLLCFVFLPVDQVWNQAVAFHWAARRAYPPGSLYEKWRTLSQLMAGERLLIMAAPLAGLCLFGGIDGLALFAWPSCTFLALLDHRPLYDHHLVALIPPLAATIGVGANYLGLIYMPFARWLSKQLRQTRIIGATIAFGAIPIVLRIVLGQAWLDVANLCAVLRRSAIPSPDLHLAELIVKHSRPDEMIVTDAQGLAFLAGRDVPPDLADTSFTRISSGYLEPLEVIDQAEQYNVRLMLLWTQRLGSMPQVVRWAERRFPHRIELGRGRVLYMLD